MNKNIHTTGLTPDETLGDKAIKGLAEQLDHRRIEMKKEKGIVTKVVVVNSQDCRYSINLIAPTKKQTLNYFKGMALYKSKSYCVGIAQALAKQLGVKLEVKE